MIEYNRDTDLVALIDAQRYGPVRRWLERELVQVPCRCPVCNRRTDLSRMPDVQQAVAETRIGSHMPAYHRQYRLQHILRFISDKLANRDDRYLVFCDRCTLADLHRLNNPHRIDYYKKGRTHGRHHRHS